MIDPTQETSSHLVAGSTALPGPKEIEEILTALEYGQKKEEIELLDDILGNLGVTRKRDKAALATAIHEESGFEQFFFAVLNAVRPFALMLKDIYTFLNDRQTTAMRRASIFRVSSSEAEQKLEFDLDNFPRELIAALTRIDLVSYVIELRFPELEPGGDPLEDWHSSSAGRAWDAIAPRWDNDFYDDGFHRALSYAATILPPGDTARWTRVRDLADPLLDRLAAIVIHASSTKPVELRPARLTDTQGEDGTFQSSFPTASYHRAAPSEDPDRFLLHPVRSSWRSNPGENTVRDELDWLLYSCAVAIHLFRSERLQRGDRDDWLSGRLRIPFQSISPDDYLRLLGDLAADYRERLDVVAPVVGEFRQTALEEKLLEFLLLPFWKNRWFLYELWTLVLVLGVAEETGPLKLLQLREIEGGSVEWNLPGGTATSPVAAVGPENRAAQVWTQRKTYHPETGEGLEPDLRITAGQSGFHDLVIIENKDRRRPPGRDMEEIARRYVEGTWTQSLWLLNYDEFSKSLSTLPDRWPERRVHVVSGFKPNSVPDDFFDEIRAILTAYLGLDKNRTEPEDEISIELAWGSSPRDLDLHASILRGTHLSNLSFSNRGQLDALPFALLDHDNQQGNGSETLRLLRTDVTKIALSVHNYSGDAPLAGSGASLEIRLGGDTSITVLVPDQGHGRWWQAFELTLPQGHLKILNRITDLPLAGD